MHLAQPVEQFRESHEIAEFGFTPEKVARWRNRFLDGGNVAVSDSAMAFSVRIRPVDRIDHKHLDRTLNQLQLNSQFPHCTRNSR
jgi:hypothetical protein